MPFVWRRAIGIHREDKGLECRKQKLKDSHHQTQAWDNCAKPRGGRETGQMNTLE